MKILSMLKIFIPILYLIFYAEFSRADDAALTHGSWRDISIEEQEQYLSESSQNTSLPISQRVSATIELGRFSGVNAIIAVGRASRSADPELRIASVQAAEQWQGRAKWDVVSPLLDDDSELVRSAAVRALIPIWPILPESYQNYLGQNIDIYLRGLPETLEADLERAWFYSIQNDLLKSKDNYQRLNRKYSDARISVAYVQVLNNNQEHDEAKRILLEQLTVYPKDANLHYRLGLTNHQLGLVEQFKSHLSIAYEYGKDNAKIGYTYALSIRSTQPNKAIDTLTQAYAIDPNPSYLYAKCDTLLMVNKEANRCLSQLETVAPEHIVTELKSHY